MFITNYFNDTNFVSIRRSIYIILTLSAFVSLREISVSFEKGLGGLLQSPDEIILSNGQILSVLLIVQVYLLVRLQWAKPIELAKLEKVWLADELSKDEDLLEQFKKLRAKFDQIAKMEKDNILAFRQEFETDIRAKLNVVNQLGLDVEVIQSERSNLSQKIDEFYKGKSQQRTAITILCDELEKRFQADYMGDFTIILN